VVDEFPKLEDGKIRTRDVNFHTARSSRFIFVAGKGPPVAMSTIVAAPTDSDKSMQIGHKLDTYFDGPCEVVNDVDDIRGWIDGPSSKERHYGAHIEKAGAANEAFLNPYLVDDPDIIGSRRRKVLSFPSYRCSLILSVDNKTVKKDINQQFFIRHPQLQSRDIKLTHIRSLKYKVLQLALSESSPLELSTVAFAVWYFERLVARLLATKGNRKLLMSVCVVLAVKFWESGNMAKKIDYALEKLDSLFGVVRERIRNAEFRTFVALDFALLPPKEGNVGGIYMERLLQLVHVTMREFLSKNFFSDIQWD
jgi:hypothetical protein